MIMSLSWLAFDFCPAYRDELCFVGTAGVLPLTACAARFPALHHTVVDGAFPRVFKERLERGQKGCHMQFLPSARAGSLPCVA